MYNKTLTEQNNLDDIVLATCSNGLGHQTFELGTLADIKATFVGLVSFVKSLFRSTPTKNP